MYTAFHLAVELPGDLPMETVLMLDFMTGQLDGPPKVTPHHALFQTCRWVYMLRSDSFYFPAETYSAFTADSDAYYLTVLSNFKNYDNEIGLFLDWLSPHIHQRNLRDWIGYEWYELDSEPKPIYRSNLPGYAGE
jgi:hypothetical protein